MSFSSSEKSAAQTIKIMNVENISAGVIGHAAAGVTASSAQNVGLSAKEAGAIAALIVGLIKVERELPHDAAIVVKAEVQNLQEELKGDARKPVLLGSLRSVKTVLENAAGGALGAAASPQLIDLIHQIGKLLGI